MFSRRILLKQVLWRCVLTHLLVHKVHKVEPSVLKVHKVKYHTIYWLCNRILWVIISHAACKPLFWSLFVYCEREMKGRWKGVKWDVGDYCFSKRGSLRGLVYVNGLCDFGV